MIKTLGPEQIEHHLKAEFSTLLVRTAKALYPESRASVLNEFSDFFFETVSYDPVYMSRMISKFETEHVCDVLISIYANMSGLAYSNKLNYIVWWLVNRYDDAPTKFVEYVKILNEITPQRPQGKVSNSLLKGFLFMCFSLYGTEFGEDHEHQKYELFEKSPFYIRGFHD